MALTKLLHSIVYSILEQKIHIPPTPDDTHIWQYTWNPCLSCCFSKPKAYAEKVYNLFNFLKFLLVIVLPSHSSQPSSNYLVLCLLSTRLAHPTSYTCLVLYSWYTTLKNCASGNTTDAPFHQSSEKEKHRMQHRDRRLGPSRPLLITVTWKSFTSAKQALWNYGIINPVVNNLFTNSFYTLVIGPSGL